MMAVRAALFCFDMIKAGYILLVTICFLFVEKPCEAQIWPFKKRSQTEKASKDLEERKRDAGEENFFNSLKPFGSSQNEQRDDYIWASATAATSYYRAGNISITTPSRYGLKPGVELLSLLGVAYWTPNLFLKREISRKKIWISSLHGIYSSSLGFQHVYRGRDTFLADSLSGIPMVLSIKNELLFSRAFFSKLECNPSRPYLILSGAIGVDYGIGIDDEVTYQSEKHFYTPRRQSYAGEGWLLKLSLRADWEAFSDLYVRGEIRSLMGDFPSRVAWEQQASIEYFVGQSISFSGGYMLGYANLGSHNLGILPFFDLSLYFGRKQSPNQGLFGVRMF
jgi:hypothetical protein